MNLFHKVKQGMIDGTKTIKEISSDVSEMTRLKVALSKDKAQLDGQYYNLGKILYEVFEENKDLKELPSVVVASLQETNDIHSRIQEHELKIESLKGIVKCSKCGVEVDDEAKYCSNCGNHLIYFHEESDLEEETLKFLAETDVSVEEVEEFEEIKPE